MTLPNVDFNTLAYDDGMHLVKTAAPDMSQILTNIKEYFNTNPEALKSLKRVGVGAGVGGGLGLLSSFAQDKNRRTPIRRALTGALMGGGGVGAYELVNKILADRANEPKALLEKARDESYASSQQDPNERDYGAVAGQVWNKGEDAWNDLVGNKGQRNNTPIDANALQAAITSPISGNMLPATAAGAVAGGTAGHFSSRPQGILGELDAHRGIGRPSWRGGLDAVRKEGLKSLVAEATAQNMSTAQIEEALNDGGTAKLKRKILAKATPRAPRPKPGAYQLGVTSTPATRVMQPPADLTKRLEGMTGVKNIKKYRSLFTPRVRGFWPRKSIGAAIGAVIPTLLDTGHRAAIGAPSRVGEQAQQMDIRDLQSANAQLDEL